MLFWLFSSKVCWYTVGSTRDGPESGWFAALKSATCWIAAERGTPAWLIFGIAKGTTVKWTSSFVKHRKPPHSISRWTSYHSSSKLEVSCVAVHQVVPSELADDWRTHPGHSATDILSSTLIHWDYNKKLIVIQAKDNTRGEGTIGLSCGWDLEF